ncbi:MAG: carbohydrate ABC transporter substrate-binding protein [Clostridia bacterium]|nr:carbohydrate ABC transporter substrate-binding protein [Clostridia bacterium]
MKKILSLVLALMMLVGCMSFAGAEEAITLNVWSFTNELEGMINKYYAPSHPNVTINYTIYPTDGGAYTSAVDNLLAANATAEEAPDIFTLEAAFVKKYVNSDWTADLIGDLGFTEEELAVAIPVMRQIGTSNVNGKLKGLSWQATPGALMYRADLAEKYLGVTTPEEFQAKVADWDLFLETAAEVNEKSEGATKMVVGEGDIWNAYNYGRTQGWVVDGKLVIDDLLYDFLDMVKTLEEDDLSNKGNAWSETWFQGMKTDSTLCFFLPTWGLHYTLKPNCGLTTNDTMNDEELKAACEADGGTYGLWKMVAGPVGYSWGGTWIGANAAKVAEASDAKKAAIKDFIKFFTLSEEFLYQYALDSGDFVGSNAVVEKILAEGGTPNPFLGGQDHYSIFAEAANLANGAIMTDYDETMNSLWRDNVTTPYSKGEVDLDTAIANFKAAVAAQFPELVVE